MLERLKGLKAKVEATALECSLEAHAAQTEVYGYIAKHSKMFSVAAFAVFAVILGVAFAIGFPATAYANNNTNALTAVGNNVSGAITRAANTILLIVNPAAGLFLIIAFMMKMFSKNQRAVDDAGTWIKRIFICLILINAVGLVVNFAVDIIGTGHGFGAIAGGGTGGGGGGGSR